MSVLSKNLSDPTPLTGIIKLFQLRLPTQTLFFHSHDTTSILFQGNTYVGLPMKVEGIEARASGSQARPILTVGNLNGSITSIIENYDHLIGYEIVMITTFGEYLNTNIYDDSKFHREMFFIEQIQSETMTHIEFVLSSALDFENAQIPKRNCYQNGCPWKYASGQGCSWPRTNPAKYFDAFGNPVATLAQDVCGKRLTDCEKRFGEDAPIPFGGMPGLGRY